MHSALARTVARFPAIAVVLACTAGAAGIAATVPGAPGLSTVTTILWLLGLGAAVCLLLRRAIDADDRSRALASSLAGERAARQLADGMLLETQTVLSRVVRQQEALRDSERDRLACDIDGHLAQDLLALHVELSLLQVSSKGIHPVVHQKAGAMVATLDGALRSLRLVVAGLRGLGPDEHLHAAMVRQIDEFTRLTGIACAFDAAPGTGAPGQACAERDALLYRALREALAGIAARASASEVGVSLQHAGGGLVLRIEDNGAEAAGRDPRDGCAIAGMRPRIEALGGTLQADAAGGRGTGLTLCLPAREGP